LVDILNVWLKENNIKMDHKETVWGLDSSGSGYRPVLGSFEKGNGPSDTINV
jgi:hypothetical protein